MLEGRAMSLLKYIELTGESTESWAQAGRAAYDGARQTLREIRHIEVTRLTARVEPDGGLMYQTTLKLAFSVERDMDDEPLAVQQAAEIVSEEGMP
jgi:flavin-binding protein dodecin